jgi:hypothetical protein
MSRECSRHSSHHQVGKGATFALVAALALIGLPHTGNAQAAKKASTASLEGSWSGGGSVSFASGAKEQARCRAHYRSAGTSSYTVNATCATASGRFSRAIKLVYALLLTTVLYSSGPVTASMQNLPPFASE